MTRSKYLTLAVFSLLGATLAFGQAQYKVLYNFGTNGGTVDGQSPNGGLVLDAAGNIYGTTISGGAYPSLLCSEGCGTVFELSPDQGGGWTETVLHSFSDAVDGSEPAAGLISDSQGNLYGTTFGSGNPACEPPECGTVFRISISQDGSWTETILYSFLSSEDGAFPEGALTFDTLGNLYGATTYGGPNLGGSVFELSPTQGSGAWSKTVVYQFCSVDDSCPDGESPRGGVTFDRTGNLYGTTEFGGKGGVGTVFQLSENHQGQWLEKVLYSFDGATGAQPWSNVSIDSFGNLYGTFFAGGAGRNGYCYRQQTFRPKPPTVCGGLFDISSSSGKENSFLFGGLNGGNPVGGVTMDGGKFYGVTSRGGTTSNGTVFQIQRTKEVVLHSFCSNGIPCDADGQIPDGPLAIYKGSLFGTTTSGGAYYQGTIFEVTR